MKTPVYIKREILALSFERRISMWPHERALGSGTWMCEGDCTPIRWSPSCRQMLGFPPCHVCPLLHRHWNASLSSFLFGNQRYKNKNPSLCCCGSTPATKPPVIQICFSWREQEGEDSLCIAVLITTSLKAWSIRWQFGVNGWQQLIRAEISEYRGNRSVDIQSYWVLLYITIITYCDVLEITKQVIAFWNFLDYTQVTLEVYVICFSSALQCHLFKFL